MTKVLQERRSRSLPSSTESNLRDHVNSISTIVEIDTTLIRRIGSTRYVVSAQQNSKLIFEPRQATVPFPSRLYDDFRNERKGSYGLKDLDAYSIRTAFRNGSLPIKEKDSGSFTLPCYINNVCFEKSLADLGASVSVMPLLTYLNLVLDELAHTKLTVELVDRTVKHPKGIAENVLVGIGKFVFPVDFIILDIPEDVNVPLILERPFLSTAHAKVDVFKRKITLRVGDEKIIFKSIKPASSLIKRVYMLGLRERMDLDLEARLIGETLILSRLLDLLYGDYIELNNLNEPLELKRN
ncbi:retrovirus-related pol polyprotein from transposon TNT 1-94 [Tanacetum coccineum]